VRPLVSRPSRPTGPRDLAISCAQHHVFVIRARQERHPPRAALCAERFDGEDIHTPPPALRSADRHPLCRDRCTTRSKSRPHASDLPECGAARPGILAGGSAGSHVAIADRLYGLAYSHANIPV